MVYVHGEWKLYEMIVNFKGIGKRTSYFFSKKTPKRGTPCDMPSGYEVGTNPRTGMPYLKYTSDRQSNWKKWYKKKR